MERKARENLEAARLLLAGEDACSNAAANRAYYAAYHACWSALNDAGVSTPEVRPGVSYFRHDSLPHAVQRAGLLDGRGGEELTWLHSLRVTADYHGDDVTVEEAKMALSAADAIVQRLLEEEPW